MAFTRTLLLPLVRSFALLAFVFASVAMVAAENGKKVKVLILDGQNNHAWATTTPMLKRILADAGVFTVEVSTAPGKKPTLPKLPKEATDADKAALPAKIKAYEAELAAYTTGSAAAWARWRPNFSAYDVVVSNYNGEAWPVEVQKALTDFVKKGGGFVSYHAADNAFPEWPEYNAMIGIGGWGGRNEKSGPYLRLRANGWFRDTQAGPGGGHGPQHEFLIVNRAPEHPITRGLPERWMNAKDELYHGLRGPAENVHVLASAYSAATKEDEPMLMAIPYGQGRVFHTTLGHGVESVNGRSFQITFARGVEWAATGQVTQPAPKAGVLTADKPAVKEIEVQ